MKKEILISSAIILAIVAVVIILNYKTSVPTEINSRTCSSDNDCIIVATLDPQNPCCGTCGSEAISGQAEAEREKWHAENCGGVACPMYDCYNEKLPKPRCINNQCEIEWAERNSAE